MRRSEGEKFDCRRPKMCTSWHSWKFNSQQVFSLSLPIFDFN